ncbi:MAG: sulfurtransferase TusA family protein [Candidatus Krumholzibacteria bacterium]|nr:sulfurtransferase TusA family protein [Candidatus Krumholzibacteria bacterium]
MDVNVDRNLDCKGLSCPMPMLKLAKEMKGMDGGQVLEMVGTDPGSKGDVPGWCEKTGNELLGVEEDAGIFKFYIRKG